MSQKLMVLVALCGVNFALWPLIKDCHNATGGTGREMASVRYVVMGNTTKSTFHFGFWSDIAFVTLSLPPSTRSVFLVSEYYCFRPKMLGDKYLLCSIQVGLNKT